MTAAVPSSRRPPAGECRFRCRSPVAVCTLNNRAMPPVTPKSPCRKQFRVRSDRYSGSATVYSADQRIARAGSPAVKSP
jgi:hypothetical protein